MQRHGGLEIRSEQKPGCGTKRNDARELYKGWLSVERSMYPAIDSYVTERLQVFSGGWLEVRKYRWSQPVEVIWSTEKRCYLLSMALDGQETATVVTDLRTGQRRELDPKARTIMVPPRQLLKCNSEAGQVRSLRCVLDAELVESYLNAIPMWDWSRVSLDKTHNLSGTQIEWLLRRMYREICQPDFATVSVIEALAKQLSVEILRKFCPPRADRSEYWGGLSPRHKRLIRERVNSHQPLPDREELADLCDMTIRHLSRAFRTETGQTLGRYIDSVMVDRANGMLMAGASVRDVADSLGYATASSLTSAFRRATGLLPSEVKANKKGHAVRDPRPDP
jgi:AraC family transcriptional regulator